MLAMTLWSDNNFDTFVDADQIATYAAWRRSALHPSRPSSSTPPSTARSSMPCASVHPCGLDGAKRQTAATAACPSRRPATLGSSVQ